MFFVVRNRWAINETLAVDLLHQRMNAQHLVGKHGDVPKVLNLSPELLFWRAAGRTIPLRSCSTAPPILRNPNDLLFTYHHFHTNEADFREHARTAQKEQQEGAKAGKTFTCSGNCSDN